MVMVPDGDCDNRRWRGSDACRGLGRCRARLRIVAQLRKAALTAYVAGHIQRQWCRSPPALFRESQHRGISEHAGAPRWWRTPRHSEPGGTPPAWLRRRPKRRVSPIGVATNSAHIPGVPEGIPTRLRPDGQSVWLRADGYCLHRATRCIDRIDNVVEPA